MSMANLAMAQAMALQQEQQQNEQFARQNAAGQFGTDHLGNAVNRSQRQAWNDRVSRFRQQRGPATGSQVFDAIQEGGGQQYAGENVNQGADGMAPGNWADPNGTGWGSMIGRGVNNFSDQMNGYGQSLQNGVAAFGRLGDRLGNSAYGATPAGRAINGALGRPQASGYDMTDGWNDENDQGGMGSAGGFGGDVSGGMGANSGGVGGSRW